MLEFRLPSATASIALFLAGLAWACNATAQAPFDEVGGAFSTPVFVDVGQQPYSAVVANLDGDAPFELVVGNEGSDNLAISQGDGQGAFGSATYLAAGDGAQGVLVVDIDGDLDLDIVVANLWASTLTVRRNDGTGVFALPETIPVGANPHTVIAANVDGDSDPDLVTANGGAGVSVLINNGAGIFALAVTYPAGINLRDVAAAKLDGDADLDLVVTNEGASSVSVLLGNGDGTFGAPQFFAVGAQPQSVSVGDLDLDGDLDLAIPCSAASEVSVLLGNGTGGFVAGTSVPTLAYPTSARLVDLDVDGRLDLVVTALNDRVLVYRGYGAAQFSASTLFGAGEGSRAPWPADVNGDGRIDLVVVAAISNKVAVLRNTSQPPLNIPPSAGAHASTSYERRKSEIWINRQTSGYWPAAYPFSHAGYADFDRDGDTDFVRTFSDNNNPYPVQVQRNNGAGTFIDATASVISGPQPDLRAPRKVISGDYNADGWPDIFVAAHGIDAPPFPGEPPRLFLSNGNGTLSWIDGPAFLPGFNHCAASADLDANGSQDILVGRTGAPYMLINSGGAQFEVNLVRLPPGISFISCEFADIDQDGYVDLVVDGYEPKNETTRVYWGQVNGLYRASLSYVVPAVPDFGVVLDFAIEDLDRDGKRDLVVNRTGSTNLYQGRYLQILRRTEARSFADETATRMSMNKNILPLDFIRAQDINGDGSVDLFIDDRNDIASGEYAWTNNGQGVFAPYFGPVSPSIALFSNGFE